MRALLLSIAIFAIACRDAPEPPKPPTPRTPVGLVGDWVRVAPARSPFGLTPPPWV